MITTVKHSALFSKYIKMTRTGILHDTWKEEALQKFKWRGLLRKATSAVEEQRQQEYQRLHDRSHSAATLGIFQCSNCQRYRRSHAGLTAHMRACLRQASTQTQDSHLRQRRTAIIINKSIKCYGGPPPPPLGTGPKHE